MIVGVRKVWRYVGTKIGMRLDELADPAVQLTQAVEDMKLRRRALMEQASMVIGQTYEYQDRLSRRRREQQALEQRIRKTLQAAEDARGRGDDARAAALEYAVRGFGTQLATVKAQIKDNQEGAANAEINARNARQMVQQNELQLRDAEAKRDQLLSALEAVKLQEQMNRSMAATTGLTTQEVPSLREIEDKIASRYSRQMAKAELLKDSMAQQILEVEYEDTLSDGDAEVDAIRVTMGMATRLVPPPKVILGEARVEDAEEQQAQPEPRN